jgi:hypothetical protein
VAKALPLFARASNKKKENSSVLIYIANKPIFDKKSAMIVSEIELYEALEEQVGKEKARILVKYVEQKIEKGFEDKKRYISN